MPDHIHGIVILADPAPSNTGQSIRVQHRPGMGWGIDKGPAPRGPRRSSIAAIIGSFKAAAARGINLARGTPGLEVWQRGYYEHVIRSERALDRIRSYIVLNPQKWRT
jgi:putative transposase